MAEREALLHQSRLNSLLPNTHPLACLGKVAKGERKAWGWESPNPRKAHQEEKHCRAVRTHCSFTREPPQKCWPCLEECRLGNGPETQTQAGPAMSWLGSVRLGQVPAPLLAQAQRM